MTTIGITPGMSLRDIAVEAYRQTPSGIDFVEQPDGIITFTDDLRPGESFAFGHDRGFGGGDPDGVAWAVYADAEAATGYLGDVDTSDGCDYEHLDELATALTGWLDRVPTDIEWHVESADEDVDLRTLTAETLVDMRVEAWQNGDHELVRAIAWALRARP